MSYASWLAPNKTSGSGNDTVNVSASVHTGRGVRETLLTFSAANCQTIGRAVAQQGAVEFVNIQSTKAAEKGGGTITITGTSNSKKLTFTSAVGEAYTELTIPTHYTAAGVTTENGTDIAGDPGNAAEYSFSITITIPSNTSVSTAYFQLIVTDNAGNTSACDITQAAGDAYLNVSPSELVLNADGTAKSFTVSSNTNWTVS